MYDNLLPLVKKEIGGPLQKDISSIKDEIYLKRRFRLLERSNPVIGEFIREFAETTDDKRGAMFCGLVVHQMLENQAVADRMNSEMLP